MTLQTFYLGTWTVMVVLGMGLSSLASLTAGPFLAIAGFASLWALMGGWSQWRRYRPSPAGVTVVAVVLAGVGALLAEEDRDLVAGLSSLLWSALPVFLYRRQKPYGHWLGLFTIAAISLISVMIREEMFPFVLFLFFILVLVLNLNATNLLQLAGTQGSRRYRLPNEYFRGLVPAFVWGAVTAGLIFFLFPRTGNWANPLALRGEDSYTGYKGTIQLESATRIRESERVEMQIVSSDPIWIAARFPTLYFRGNTVEHFDGANWTPLEREWSPVFSNTDLRYTVAHQGKTHRLEIFREQHRDRAVFYPGVLSTIRVPWNLTRGLLTDGAGNLKRYRMGGLRYSYEVRVTEPVGVKPRSMSSIRRNAPRELGAEAADLLQVPQAVRDSPEWKDWQRELGVSAWKDLPISEVFSRIQRHFSGNYRATLVHEFEEELPLNGFLKRKEGHCEYFATATALLLRSQGIPARLVLGFLGGVYNEISETVEVRAKNAHAWVEVYTAPGVWTLLDPTPLVGTGNGTGFSDQWTKYSHALAFWFNRYVVQYNMDTQRRLMRSFANLGRRSRQPFSWPAVGRNLLVVVLLVGLFWSAGRYLPRRRRRRESLPSYYREFLAWAAKRGWQRESGESRRVFHQRIARVSGEWVDDIDRAIHRDQYSSHPLSAEEREQLKKTTRKHL